MTPASVPKQPWSGEETFTVSGFPTSKNAERIGKLPRQTIIDECLKQLDEMFANGVGQKLANNREMDEELDVKREKQKEKEKETLIFTYIDIHFFFSFLVLVGSTGLNNIPRLLDR